MPTNFTPILTNAPARASTFNAPLQELDNALKALQNLTAGPAFINVMDEQYGASPSASRATNDAAFAAAIADAGAAGGGKVYVPPGTFQTSNHIRISSSNITLCGSGPNSIIDFWPNALAQDRVVYIHPTDVNANISTADRPVTGTIAIGDTSFVSTNAGDVTDLVAGDWIMMAVKPVGMDFLTVDFVQVLSKVGTTVNLVNPFRVAFDTTYGSIMWHRLVGVPENVTVSDLTLRFSGYTAPAIEFGPCIVPGISRNVLVERVVFDPAGGGNDIMGYRCMGLTIRDCVKLHGGSTFSAEIAACQDVSIVQNRFLSVGAAPPYYGIALDYGTCFFDVSGNHFVNAADHGIFMSGGVHDGTIALNNIGFVKGLGADPPISGIRGWGCKRVTVALNTLAGAGGASKGISMRSDSTHYTPTLASDGNVIALNKISNFASEYDTLEAGDLYLIPNGAALGINRVTAQAGLHVRGDATVRDLLELEDTNSNRRIHIGPGESNHTFGIYDQTATAERLYMDANGMWYIPAAGKGVVVTTPDGAHTYSITVNNAGAITSTLIT